MQAVDVIVREVGLRDGLQIHPTFMPTDRKIAWIEAEAAAGVTEIEVTSYVPPKLIPQFVDAEEVTRRALDVRGLTVAALIPNSRGADCPRAFSSPRPFLAPTPTRGGMR
jgi:hydroxymethylglutaryl-CoA lyase